VGRYVALVAVALPFLAIAALAVLFMTSHASLTVSSDALATVNMPLEGGTLQRIQVIAGPQAQAVPIKVRGNQIWPTGTLKVGEKVVIDATVKRPGWISWLAGKTEQIHLTLTTPSTGLRSLFLTRAHGAPLVVHFRRPVRTVAYGTVGSHLKFHALRSAHGAFTLPEDAIAGTIAVAAAPRSWERARPQTVSWFPAGAKASAVATPAPGTAIKPGTRITLTFNKPVDKALGDSRPPVTPSTQGTWHTVNSHTIAFVPEGYGYGLGAHVTVALPAGVNLVGGQANGSDPVGRWSVPAGSTLRLQQLLADLGYLPVNFSAPGTAAGTSITSQENAAVAPPHGHFSWRYANTPTALRSQWAPGSYGELTKGAVMAFESEQGMATDGVAGPAVWKALMQATVSEKKSPFGYTYVSVSEGSPETIHVWHNGKTVVSGVVNTGIAAAPTATGTFAVYEHIPVGTMSGHNPDGSAYHDPGIPWISYFNGGDALHGFVRASYGFPQSLGCVEMPYTEAGQVYPYTPIGTIVNVT
jgi:peptidoglycan hydrolase-like protein with peptidoglycan-binding domain